jgi:RHS repeat-associated protein
MSDTKTKYIYAGDDLVATIETKPVLESMNGYSSVELEIESQQSSSMCCQNEIPVSHTIHYVHSDHLAGSNVVTDSSGALEETLDYYPFGKVRLDETVSGFKTDHKFTGYFYDEASELNYASARYQDGKRGQFLSQDPAFLAVGNPNELKSKTGADQQMYLSDPQGMNSYSYAKNNPLKYVDQDGNFWQAIVALGIIYSPQILSFGQSLLTPLGQVGLSQTVDDAKSGNYTMAAIGAVTAGEFPTSAGKYVPVFDGLWTVGGKATRAENVVYHTYQAGRQGVGHAAEFGITDAKTYVAATRDFITDSINKGYQAKLETVGSADKIRVWDKGNNVFSAFEVNRDTKAITPATMFKPQNRNYFSNQPGKSINIKKYFGR